MASPQPDKYTKISNELLEALAKIRIAGEARQMLDVIIRKTYGFNKKEDRIATLQFMELTGLSRLAIPKARRKLITMNLITISQKGYRQGLTYSFQKDYEKWKPYPKKDTVSKKGQRYIPKRIQVYTKKDNNCIPKGSIQKKERQYTKETITKDIEQGQKSPCDTNKVFGFFCLKYKEAFSKEYIANFAKDKKIIKDLLRIVPSEELEQLILIYFVTPDDYSERAGYSIGMFKTKINSLRIEKRTLKVSDKTLKSIEAARSWLKRKEQEIVR